jgi:hypothetical protein
VGAFISISEPGPGQTVDVTVDDAVTNYDTDLDEFLTSQGWDFVEEDPPTTLDEAAAEEVAPVISIRESGGQDLGIAAIADGQLLSRSGTTVVGSAGAAHPWTEDEFTPTNGQVTFILSQTPTDLSSLMVNVNGVTADEGTDYTVSGTTVTWLNNLYSMETTDFVVVRYRS